MLGGKTGNRIEKYDIARGCGILLITLGHCSVPAVLNHYIYAFHVPLFFLISGRVFNKDKYCSSELNMKTIVLSKAKAYLLPYLIMYIINLLIVSFSWRGLNLFGYFSSILRYFVDMVKADRVFPNCEALWFLPCMFLANILFILIIHSRRKAVLFIPGLALLYLVKVIVFPSAFFWHAEVALLGASFMLIGHLTRKVMSDIKLIKRFVLIGVFLFLGGLAAFANTDGVDLNHLRTGNLVLFYIHSVLLSLAFIELSGLIPGIMIRRVLMYFGNNTLPIMGFNFQCILLAGSLIAVIKDWSLYWIAEFVLSVSFLVLAVQIWGLGKRLFRHLHNVGSEE